MMKNEKRKKTESAVEDNMRSKKNRRESKKMLFEWKQDFLRWEDQGDRVCWTKWALVAWQLSVSPAMWWRILGLALRGKSR